MKWRRYPEDVLPMWVAEMDSQLADPIAGALQKAIADGNTGYVEGTAYAEALKDFAAQRWSWQIGLAHTTLVPDVMLGIVEMLKLLTVPGDAVVINPPVYPPFYTFLTSMGLRAVEAPLGADGRLDLSTLERVFPQAKVYLLCSPHNPTGAVHTPAELAAVAQLARQHQVRVIADEIHAPLTLPGATFTPYLTVPGSQDAFCLMSASKAWNLAALKGALVIAGSDAAAELARVPQELSDGVSHFGVIAHIAALREGGEWLDGLLSDLDSNRQLLATLLADNLPMVGYQPPQATYLTWLDCRDLELGDDPAAVFLRNGRLAVNSGHLFGTGGAGRVRMNIATSPELIAEGVRRMASALVSGNGSVGEQSRRS